LQSRATGNSETFTVLLPMLHGFIARRRPALALLSRAADPAKSYMQRRRMRKREVPPAVCAQSCCRTPVRHAPAARYGWRETPASRYIDVAASRGDIGGGGDERQCRWCQCVGAACRSHAPRLFFRTTPRSSAAFDERRRYAVNHATRPHVPY